MYGIAHKTNRIWFDIYKYIEIFQSFCDISIVEMNQITLNTHPIQYTYNAITEVDREFYILKITLVDPQERG